jgi:hypothetical protein
MRRLVRFTVVLALVALLPASARATLNPGELGRDHGAGGCSGACDGSPVPLNGTTGTPVTVARDAGERLYVLTTDGVFQVTPAADGSLGGTGTCLTVSAAVACDALRGVSDPVALLTTDDGSGLVVAGSAGIASLVRDPSSGALVQPAGTAGCMTVTATAGCGSLPPTWSVSGARDVVVTPDGASIHALVRASAAWRVFSVNRDPGTGALTGGACASTDGSDGGGGVCAAIAGAGSDANSIAASDEALYVTATCTTPTCADIVVIRRSGGAHDLVPEAGAAACLGSAPGCTASPMFLGGVPQLLPNGRLAIWLDTRAAFLARDVTTGALSPPASVSDCLGAGCATPWGFSGGTVTFSDDGYAYGESTVFAVDPVGGSLSVASLLPPDDRVTDFFLQRVMTPAHRLYQVQRGSIFRAIREVAPDCAAPAEFSGYGRVLIPTGPLPCSDRNGDPIYQTLASAPAHGQFTPGTGYISNAGFVGSDQMSLTMSDGTLTTGLDVHLHVLASPILRVSIASDAYVHKIVSNGRTTYVIDCGAPPCWPVPAAVTLTLSTTIGIPRFAQPGVMRGGHCLDIDLAPAALGRRFAFITQGGTERFCVAELPDTTPIPIEFRIGVALSVAPTAEVHGSNIKLGFYRDPGVAGTFTAYRLVKHKRHRWSRAHVAANVGMSVTIPKRRLKGTWLFVFTPPDTRIYVSTFLLIRVRTLKSARHGVAQLDLGPRVRRGGLEVPGG